MPREEADDTEYQDMVIPRTIGGDADDDYDELELSGDDDDNLDDDDYHDDDPRFAAMSEQMTGMQTMMQQQGQFYQTAFAQLMSNNGQPDAAAAADQGAFDLEDLPDPVEDRAGFNKALAAKVTGFVDNQVRSTENRVSTGNLEQNLSNQFRADHPELAKKGAIFRAAVTEEANILATSGVNAATTIGANPSAFLDKVAARMNNELGIDPNDDDNQNDDDDGRAPRRKVRRQKAQGDNSRSRNLGKPSRPRRRGQPKKPAKPKGFINELRQQQADMGLI